MIGLALESEPGRSEHAHRPLCSWTGSIALRATARAWTLALVFNLFACALSAPLVSTDASSVRLVVLVSVDQLRRERLHPEMPGGLGRLVREGRTFSAAALEHALTDTCPGHATMLTGRHPGPAGIPSNVFLDRVSLEPIYCALDRSERGVLLGAAASAEGPRSEDGRSPHNLQASTLGDWLKKSRPEAKVFSVSAKDRSAIMLGGRGANVAYWLDRDAAGRFTTSRYYLDELPPWAAAWTIEHVVAPLPERWVHATKPLAGGARPDDYPGESPLFGRTSPHPLKTRGDDSATIAQLLMTPYLDTRTLDFARDLIENEGLGTGPGVDLLGVSLSATDYIGHMYGPGSQEARDALEHLDVDLGNFLGYLDERLGAGRVAVVLTADHGVMSLPGWAIERSLDQTQCKVAKGRVQYGEIEQGLTRYLDKKLGSPEGRVTRWLVRAGFVFVADPSVARARGVAVKEVLELAHKYLSQQPGVLRVWTAEEIRDARGPAPFATLYRNSRSEDYFGDLVVQPVRGCLLTSWPLGTSHGSPYDYDRKVPLVFYGPGIEPGRVETPAAPVDIAPTLAHLLGIEAPIGLDGRVLELASDSSHAPGSADD